MEVLHALVRLVTSSLFAHVATLCNYHGTALIHRPSMISFSVGLKELVNKGLIRLVSYHSKLGIYTRATNVE